MRLYDGMNKRVKNVVNEVINYAFLHVLMHSKLNLDQKIPQEMNDLVKRCLLCAMKRQIYT